MHLDSHIIIPGDQVFDIKDGYGDVVKVQGDLATALFGSKYRQFNHGGTQPRRDMRTVFWHPPLVVFPAKERLVWDTQKKLLDVVIDTLNEHTITDIRQNSFGG